MDFYELGKNGTYEDIIKHYSYIAFNIKKILKGLNDRNDTDLLIRLYNKLTFSFYEICVGCIRPLIDYILNNNINVTINEGLCGACAGGHMEIIDLLIEKGANNWNGSLYYACAGGHMEIIDLLIEKGANDWNGGLCFACSVGNIDIVKLMIKNGADHTDPGIFHALKNEHWELVEHLIMLGANNPVYENNKKYYEYLSNKLNKHKSRSLELYEVLNDLVALYT